MIHLVKDTSGIFRQRISVDGHEFFADVDAGLGGEDSAPDPHDLLDSSLAACTAITLSMFAKRRNIPLASVNIEVKRDDSREKAGEYHLEMEIELEGELSDEQRQQLMSIVEKCPIHKLLSHATIHISSTLVNSASSLSPSQIQLIPPRTQDIGFPVKRLLPSRLKQRVGPFIFVDHMGPAYFAEGTTGGDVRQHPHIGLATVTYLFSGAMMHRDSLGMVQRIEPGAINLMTAGHGIVHSERVPDDIRANQTPVEGIQTWLALPTDEEDCEPSFAHYAAERIPAVRAQGLTGRLLIGEAFGVNSPVKTASKTIYLDLQLEPGAEYQAQFPQMELAVYVVDGDVSVDGETVPQYNLGVFNDSATIRAVNSAHVLLLGGEPLAGERYILWNFVASAREKVKLAATRWSNGEFTLVPGETEWIPLPTP